MLYKLRRPYRQNLDSVAEMARDLARSYKVLAEEYEEKEDAVRRMFS